MIVIDGVQQGSDEWKMLRLGIPSASNFYRIITPGGKPSTQADGYMNKLLAEWLMGKPVDIEKNDWMLRGSELEAQARAYHAFSQDVEVTQIGLAYKDERRLISCSPDGLIDEDGGFECKCPAPWTHVGYLLADKLPTDYIPQVQGGLYVTDRKWWHFLSYHPDIEPLLIHVRRDEEYIALIDIAITQFVDKLLGKRERLKHLKREAAK